MGSSLLCFLKTDVCPLKGGVRFFPILNWSVDIVWTGARGWTLLSGISNWLQGEIFPCFPHILENMKELYPTDLSSYPTSLCSTNTKTSREEEILRCFIVSVCSWSSGIAFQLILILFFQRLLMTSGFSSVHAGFSQLCRGERTLLILESCPCIILSFQFIVGKEKAGKSSAEHLQPLQFP